jgi:hypothetical protein
VARVSGPGEGYGKHFVISVEVSSSLHPIPSERICDKHDSEFEIRLKTTLRLVFR